MCKPVHQPTLRYGLHPRAAERNDLTADEVAVVPVPQGPKTVCQAAHGWFGHHTPGEGIKRGLRFLIYFARRHPIFSEYGALQ